MEGLKQLFAQYDKADAEHSPRNRAQYADCIVEELRDYVSDDRLIELVEADKEGRVEIRPCKVGDTLWFATFKRNATVCIGIQPHKVEQICTTYTVDEWTDIPDWEIGKTVFLTEPEAAAAWNRRRKEIPDE